MISYLASTVPSRVFDVKTGWGAKFPTGMKYGRGFIYPLTSKQYLDMCPPLDVASYTEKYAKHIQNGGKYAPMWLEVKWQPSQKFWQVVGHDGRHRMRALGELYGAQTTIPVKIFCRDSRGNPMTKKDFDSPTSVLYYNATLRSSTGSTPRVIKLDARKVETLF